LILLNNQQNQVLIEDNDFDKTCIDAYIQEQKTLERIHFKFYKPHPKHLEFHNLGSTARDRLFLAANRIGKTMACSLEVCMHATGNYPDWWTGYRYDKPINVWVGGITEKEINILERRYFEGEPSEDPWIHPSLVVYRNKTKHQYHILNKFGGHSLISFKTYQQGRQTWQGEKLDLCHLDEEPPLDIYTEASLRLMSTSQEHYGMMLISATCLYYSKFVQSFVEEVIEVERIENGETIKEKKQIQRTEGEVKAGRVFLMAGWVDAPHLNRDEMAHLVSKIPPHEIEARSKGVPSVGSGMVYPVSESLLTCTPFDIPSHFARIAGMDFGWKDDTTLVFGAFDRDKDILYIYFEYAANQKTPEQHIYSLSQMRGADAYRWVTIMHDPAGRSSSQRDGEKLVEIYQKNKLKMMKANNAREAGVMRVLQRMYEGKLKIFTTCNKLLCELRMYARDEEGKIKDGNDHLLDAMRYMVSGLQYAKTENRSRHENSQYITGGLI